MSEQRIFWQECVATNSPLVVVYGPNDVNPNFALAESIATRARSELDIVEAPPVESLQHNMSATETLADSTQPEGGVTMDGDNCGPGPTA